ncbi:hypothetical protein E2C01_100026 [Portunus trituberculatus]|uniref:Uncharacterized protein n=1 Tax=Portunus trituberculatus TaxID=210409 RepID=A0A5B7KIC6_PORTR|nr:hypothetical protein [Portunus trituberculatus]
MHQYSHTESTHDYTSEKNHTGPHEPKARTHSTRQRKNNKKKKHCPNNYPHSHIVSLPFTKPATSPSSFDQHVTHSCRHTRLRSTIHSFCICGQVFVGSGDGSGVPAGVTVELRKGKGGAGQQLLTFLVALHTYPLNYGGI